MAETTASGPFSTDSNARALRHINQGPSGVKGALIRVGAALGLVASGAAVEATAHPLQNVIDKTKTGVEQTVGNIQQGAENLVNFYNKDAEIQKYNEQVASRLNGRTPLLGGERIFEKVIVVPAGVDYDERQKMIDEKTKVNVRNYPSTYTPITGKETDVLGTLPQGAEISHAILVESVAPNSKEPEKWYGFLWRDPNAGANEPFEIGYIYSIYGQPESPNTITSETSSTNNTP